MTGNEVEEIKGHFDKVAQELRGDIAGVREEVAEGRRDAGVVAQGLRSEIAEVRTHTDVVAEGLRSEIAEVRRHAGVVAEDLRSEIRAVGDGVALANERIDDLDLRVDGLTSEVRRGFAGVRAEIHRLHETDDELLRRIETQERRGA